MRDACIWGEIFMNVRSGEFLNRLNTKRSIENKMEGTYHTHACFQPFGFITQMS
jgi:hypothetical protein